MPTELLVRFLTFIFSNSSLVSVNIAHIKLENYGSAIEDATKAIELDKKYIKVKW
jgi:hypothetical protein